MGTVEFLIIGILIGLLGALLGAIVDRYYTQRRQADSKMGGFLLITGGIFNTIVGTIAIIVSLFMTGSLKIALVLGLGVLIGFAVGFFILAALWIFFGKESENPAQQVNHFWTK